MNTIAASSRSGLKVVELAAGLVLLGVLAAIIVPRMLDAGKDERSARVESLTGSLRSGAHTVRTASLLLGALKASGEVKMENDVVVLTAFGYPAASSAGILRATGIDAERDRVTILVDSRAVPPTVTITPLGAANVCNVVYTQSSSPDAPPMVAPSVNGC